MAGGPKGEAVPATLTALGKLIFDVSVVEVEDTGDAVGRQVEFSRWLASVPNTSQPGAWPAASISSASATVRNTAAGSLVADATSRVAAATASTGYSSIIDGAHEARRGRSASSTMWWPGGNTRASQIASAAGST